MIIFGLVLLFVGAALTYACRQSLIPAWRSRKWPSTTGHTSGRISYEGVNQGIAVDGTFAPTENEFVDIDWVFSYQVADKPYNSSRFDFSTSGWRKNDQYLEDGTEVKVYYCPQDPSLAVLRPGLRSAPLLGPYLLAIGVAVVAFGLCTS